MTVNTIDQLTTALNANGVTKIILGSDITNDISVDRLVNLELNGKTLGGNVIITSDDYGAMGISGSGIIGGNLKINTPNATITNDATVKGETNIQAVSQNTFNSTGKHENGIKMTGSGRLNLSGNASSSNVEVDTSELVVLAGSVSGNVTVTASDAQTRVDGKIDNIKVIGANSRIEVTENASIDVVESDVDITIATEDGGTLPKTNGNGKVTKVKTYRVTFDKNTGSIDARPNYMLINENGSVGLLPIPPIKEGYTFIGWNTQADGNGKTFDGTTTISGAITVYAQYKKQLPEVDKTELEAVIGEAEEKVKKAVVGTEVGNYPQIAVDKLKEAIEIAKSVLNNIEATQEQINSAVIALNEEISIFESSVVKESEVVAKNSKSQKTYSSLEKAIEEAKSGETVVLLEDYTLKDNMTVPKGVMLLLPCDENDETGYTKSGFNPDGKGKDGMPSLFKTMTIPEGKELAIEGTVMVNAVTGKEASGHYDMDITGGYSKVILNGNISVKDGGMLDVCGIVEGAGKVTAEEGSIVRDLYVVRNFRGGTQAVYMDSFKVYPMNEYTCHNIEVPLQINYGASYLGTVKIYALSQYNRTRLPLIGSSNGLLRLNTENSYAIKTYDSQNQRGTIDIYGGGSGSNSALDILGVSVNTNAYIYPVNGNITINLHDGGYGFDEDFKFLTGSKLVVEPDAKLTVGKDRTVVFYDEFNDVPNIDGTTYPNRPAAELVLKPGANLNIDGTFAGNIVIDSESTVLNPATIVVSQDAILKATTKEANGYNNQEKGVVELNFEALIINEDATITPISGNTYTEYYAKENQIATFDKVYKEDKCVNGPNKYCGIQQPVPGVFSICIDKTKVETILGRPLKDGEQLKIKLNGQFIKGYLYGETIETFVEQGDCYILPAVQQGNNQGITIEPSTIGQPDGSTDTHPAEIYLVK